MKTENAFSGLWDKNRRASLILVDIPIGLKERGAAARRCDREARRVLGPRKASVFPVPCRAAVYQPDYDAAIRENLRLTGKSIFKAVWRIVPRIREVDELLRREPSARRVVRESHPEVSFWALNRGRPLAHPKRTAAGAAERRQLLKAILAGLQPSWGKLLEGPLPFTPRQAAPDDFLDALALAGPGPGRHRPAGPQTGPGHPPGDSGNRRPGPAHGDGLCQVKQ
ncbi:MAG: DUF429 domain-containing protein [Deltaproteobacteria bacterium]|nr:DUF429 domain-containing protein [Deltaproteobacteria bacterium]